jgi:uncharacterized membrane protein YciS (DUF1049 family)
MSTERQRIKRELSFGELRGENSLKRTWSVATYVHVDGEKYPVTNLGATFLVRIATGVCVSGETFLKARDAVAEELRRVDRVARQCSSAVVPG